MPRCDLCKQFDYCAFRSDPDAQCSEFKRKPMTNGDKVRSMSDKELAEVIKNPCDIGHHIPTEWCADINCGYQCSLDWLRKEATDGQS